MVGMRVNLRICLACGSSLAALLVHAPAVAQESMEAAQVATAERKSEPESGLADIVVTAQRSRQNLQDIPITVTAFTGEALQAAGIDNSMALQAVTPGLVINKQGAAGSVYLRGIGSRIVFAGLEPSIAVYADDRYISGQNAALFEFLDTERVEVVKGPQGVLFGRNATGGAIRVISRDATDELSFDGRVSYGNYDQREARATANLPVTSTLSARFSGLVHKRDGFAKNLDPRGRKEFNDLNVWAGRAKMKWEATPDVTARLTLDYWEQDDANALGQVVLPPFDLHAGVAQGGLYSTKRHRVATPTGGIHQHEFSAQLRVDANLGPATLAVISTYGDYGGHFAQDVDATSAVVQDAVFNTMPQKTFTQEAQLVSDPGGVFDYVVGVNYFHNEAESYTVLEVPFRLSPGGFQTVKANAYAAFGQLTFHLTDTVSFIVGGRYSYERKRLLVEDDPTSVLLADRSLLPYRDSLTNKKFTPKAVVQWDYAPHSMVYASYSRGFKSGGFFYPATPPQEILRPETLDSFELGWKADLFNRTLRFNASAFYYKYKNLQVTRSVTLPSGQAVGQADNAATASVKGIEAELTWRPIQNFTLNANGGYTHGEYDEYPDAIATIFRIDGPVPGNGLGTISVPFNATGHRMLRLPRFTASVGASYDIQLPSGHLPVTVTYAYKSAFLFDFIASANTAALRQPAYGLLSANIAYAPDGDRWKVSLFGSNLTNERYFNDKLGAAAGLRGSYGDPRTYGIALDVSF